MGASKHFDGTFTLGEFQVAAKCLENKWNSVSPWNWVSSSRFPHGAASQKEQGYLALQDALKFAVNEKISDESEQTELVDEAMLIENRSYEAQAYDFHIVYSSSYQVPIMYFHGRSLGASILESTLVNVAGEWMKLLLHGRVMKQESIVEQYLISWLSVAGRAVGLKVSRDLLGETQASINDGCLSEVVEILVQTQLN